MHFIGMLAFSLPVPVQYHVPIVLVSLIAAITASGVALLVGSQPGLGWGMWLGGGGIMGMGISIMHFTGMAAMQIPATVRYSTFLVTLSIAIAIGASLAGLGIAFRLRSDNTAMGLVNKVIGSVVMGISIPSMHYTAMAAASFTSHPNIPVVSPFSVGISSLLGGSTIITGTFLILAFTLIAAVVDRRLLSQGEKLRIQEERLRLAATGANLGTWHWDIVNQSLVWSDQCKALFGIPQNAVMSYERFLEALHPEDRARTDQAIKDALNNQEDYSIEDRTIWPDGSVHWIAAMGKGFYHPTSGQATRMEGIVIDITQRKETEEQLLHAYNDLERQVQARTATLAEANQTLKKEFWARQLLEKFPSEDPNPVMRFNSAGILIYANEAAQPILQHWQGLTVGSAPVPFYHDCIVQTLSTLEKNTFELQCNKQTFLVDIVPIAEGGYINLYAKDITDLKQTERNFRVTNQAFEASPSGIVITDPAQPDNPIVNCNPAFERLTGYSKSEILGRNGRFLHGEDRDQEGLQVLREAIAANRECQVELRNYKKDGTVFWNELRIAPAFDANNQVSHFVGIQTDISLRKQAERKFRGLLESAPDAMVIVNQQGEILLVNAQMERLFGYRREEILGQPVEILIPERFHGPHAGQRNAYFGNPRPRGMGEGRELFARRKDGSELPIEISLSPLQTEEGLLVSAAIRDITERKQAEHKIQHKNRELETLLYVTSHDLNEPLRAIQNFSQIVKDRYAERLDAKAQEYLQRVIQGSKRMSTLLSEILTLSRVQRLEPPNADIKSSDVVKEALARLQQNLEETKGTILVAPDLPLLRADPTWATQAVYNLIANALKFTCEGNAPDVEIVPYDGKGRYPEEVGLVVRDRGPGVAPAHAERIFQLFQRAVGREVKGTGAGLAIVRQVAERHGGHAWVEPREGGGADFFITFGSAISITKEAIGVHGPSQ